mmetsp:Transcript_11109/g.39264  ORF Transcript_11109/g.39264 Transcript_11109/m.39264 type:complete len:411 (+) Transcript_11109:2685-3917(+)
MQGIPDFLGLLRGLDQIATRVHQVLRVATAEFPRLADTPCLLARRCQAKMHLETFLAGRTIFLDDFKDALRHQQGVEHGLRIGPRSLRAHGQQGTEKLGIEAPRQIEAELMQGGRSRVLIAPERWHMRGAATRNLQQRAMRQDCQGQNVWWGAMLGRVLAELLGCVLKHRVKILLGEALANSCSTIDLGLPSFFVRCRIAEESTQHRPTRFECGRRVRIDQVQRTQTREASGHDLAHGNVKSIPIDPGLEQLGGRSSVRGSQGSDRPAPRDGQALGTRRNLRALLVVPARGTDLTCRRAAIAGAGAAVPWVGGGVGRGLRACGGAAADCAQPTLHVTAPSREHRAIHAECAAEQQVGHREQGLLAGIQPGVKLLGPKNLAEQRLGAGHKRAAPLEEVKFGHLQGEVVGGL